jgi:hypothetical protein
MVGKAIDARAAEEKVHEQSKRLFARLSAALRVRRGDRGKEGGVRHALVAMRRKYVIRRFPPSLLCLGSPDPVLVKGIMEGAL